MKYMGSKNKYTKYILPIILKNRKPEQWYVEPFVGGCNMIDKIDGNRIGNDIHFELIEMLKSVSKGWLPPKDITEKTYNDIKNNRDLYPNNLIGYVGFALSYAGKWFGGWCRDGEGKRDYVDEAYRNAIKQFPKLKDVTFFNKHYWDLDIPKESIIYCDPPYKGTTGYKDKFDHDIFWEWCRLMKLFGHKVFISEYTAPKDFICLWAKRVNSSLDKDTGSKQNIERLFTEKDVETND